MHLNWFSLNDLDQFFTSVASVTQDQMLRQTVSLELLDAWMVTVLFLKFILKCILQLTENQPCTKALIIQVKMTLLHWHLCFFLLSCHWLCNAPFFFRTQKIGANISAISVTKLDASSMCTNSSVLYFVLQYYVLCRHEVYRQIHSA